MSEYEFYDLISNESGQILVQFSLYLTILFAYLVSAYLVGRNLSRAQMVMLSGLFVLAAGAQAWGMQTQLGRVQEILNKKAEMFPLTEYEAGYANHGTLWVIAMIMGLMAALLFMWQVRRQQPQ